MIKKVLFLLLACVLSNKVCYATTADSLSCYDNYQVYETTAYCACRECSGCWGNQTSTGRTCIAGRTVAVDPQVIPYGSKVTIDGHTYIAEDCGSGVKGYHIDIYFDNHEEATQYGRQQHIAIVEEP